MSIQRYYVWQDELWLPGQKASDAADYMVTVVKYADHVAAVEAEAESAHDLGVIYGINHERARIKAAVQAISHLLEGATVEEVLAIIDGDADA